ncbi:hypothetical protein QE152_g15498 [Popillia japonica]|uniref:Uncharacterized protein n=1 Tax=Popillia japonica TaxID=7064 RepID=A0AAW1L856_POPJA
MLGYRIKIELFCALKIIIVFARSQEEEFPDARIPYKNRIVLRFENYNCICKKSSGCLKVLVNETVNDLPHRIEQGPTKSLMKLSALKYATGTKQTRTLYCKNKEGKLVGDEKNILKTWRGYFEDILNPKDNIHVAEVEEKYAENDEIEVLPPMKEELERIIGQLKKGSFAPNERGIGKDYRAIKEWEKCRDEWGSG